MAFKLRNRALRRSGSSYRPSFMVYRRLLALAIAWIVPFCMFSRQNHQLHTMTAIWLLPVVACEVAASSAGMLVAHLPADVHSFHLLLAGYVLWGISVLPAFAILTILMLRMALHQLPEKKSRFLAGFL